MPTRITPTPTTTRQLIIGQMYVQFMIPEEQRGWPVIMVHGGGYSGSGSSRRRMGAKAGSLTRCATITRLTWSTRPVADAPASTAPSSTSASPRVTWPASRTWATRAAAGSGRPGSVTSSGGSDITNGTLIKHGDPGDPQCATDPAIARSVTPAHPFDAVDPDIQARVGAIGPAPNPANDKQLALEHYKYGVPNTNVTLPELDVPTCTPIHRQRRRHLVRPGPGEAGQQAWAARSWSTHSQSGSVGHHMVRYLKAAGNLDQLKGLVTIDGSCSLTGAGIVAQDFAKIPYMALRGWYLSGSTALCDATVAAINSAGGTAESIKLDDPKFGNQFQGVTHMMMLGNNHLKVFDVIQDWVGKHVAGQSKKVACSRSNNDHDSDLGHDCGPHHDEICY